MCMLGVFFCASRQYAKQSVPCYGGPERSKRLQHKKRPEKFKNATKAHKKTQKIHNGIKKETHNRCKAKIKNKQINSTVEVEKKNSQNTTEVFFSRKCYRTAVEMREIETSKGLD